MATAHYDLHLTEDTTSESFLAWRRAMNGVDSSNMIKIDTALWGKSDKSTSVSATLAASSWSGTSAPFTQTISVEGLTSTGNGMIGVASTATAAQRDAARKAGLSVTGQGNETLTITADLGKPTVDIPVVITLIY